MKLLLAVLAASFLAPRADTLAFAVSRGAKVAKSIELAVEFQSKKVSIAIGGKELPEEVLAKFDMSVSHTIEYALEDEYLAVEEGRPSALVRRFQSAKSHQQSHDSMPGGKPTDDDETRESPLVGHAVEFHSDGKEARWSRAFVGGEGDKACLEPLEAGMDFVALLQPGKLEPGATWKIDAEHFNELVKPGGDLSFPTKNERKARFLFGKHPSGTIEATYAGTREEGGRKLGRIQVAMRIQTSQEPDATLTQPLGFEASFELEGEYLWDLERGRLASYKIAGPATLTATGERAADEQAKRPALKIKIEFGGELKARGAFE